MLGRAMNYDFAEYLIQQFQPKVQTIQKRIQAETQGLSRTNEKLEKNRIIADEVTSFISAITAGDMRLFDEIISIIDMKYPIYREGLLQAWQDNATKSMGLSANMTLFSSFSTIEKRLSKILPELPYLSWYISLPVRLAKPFTSKDDREMHILDNPICREWVFGMPMVRPSTWKGNLRWMARMKGLDEDVCERLFGNRTNEEREFRKGRLNFYPTLLNHISFEVITPLDRERRTPKTGPILMECIRHHPNDNLAAGEFTMLYLARPYASQKGEVFQQVADDLIYTTEILSEMLLSYGFSAKKTSGFGVIGDDFRDHRGDSLGVLSIMGISLPEAQSIRSDIGTLKQEITKLSFANCTEMCQQAKQLAGTLRGK